MRKATKIGFIAVFCAAVGLTFPVFNIFSKQLSMDSHENRLMTGLPQVLQSPLSQLPRSLDNFFVDNSPFRYQFVLLNAGIDYAVFGTSQSDQVLPGKDGWLFPKRLPSGWRPVPRRRSPGHSCPRPAAGWAGRPPPGPSCPAGRRPGCACSPSGRTTPPRRPPRFWPSPGPGRSAAGPGR